MDGKKPQLAGMGTLKLNSLDGPQRKMAEVLYIPGLDRRLLSVGKLARRSMMVEMRSSSCVIWSDKRAIASGKKVCKAYFLNCQQEEAQLVEYAYEHSEWELWHALLGHPGMTSMDNRQRATNGMPELKKSIEKPYGGCLKGKQTVNAFPSQSLTMILYVLKLEHTDLKGPMRTVSKGGERFLLTFVDDYSRFVVVYFMKYKGEVASRLCASKDFYENQWPKRL